MEDNLIKKEGGSSCITLLIAARRNTNDAEILAIFRKEIVEVVAMVTTPHREPNLSAPDIHCD